jgi:L-fucose isomerase-like protein
MDIHRALDPKEIEADAEEHWLKPAKRIVEPKRPEILNSAALYLTLRRLMREERAQAVTSSHCMGLPAKACLAFSRLNDDGLVGACEGDMDSTLTMLLFAYACGVPGFITDPLFDLAKNSVVHAHCTSATRMDGPGGERAPFTIRSQCDSEQGVSLEVEMRVGQAITCAKLAGLDTLLLSTGKIIEVPDYVDRGCRTQITTEVRDARRMMENWGGGALPEDMMTLLHRVVFYGDRRRDAEDIASLMGLRVVEEA